MNTEIIITIIAVAGIIAGIVRTVLRREFIVAQGFAGLLCQHGKFAEQLAAGMEERQVLSTGT